MNATPPPPAPSGPGPLGQTLTYVFAVTGTPPPAGPVAAAAGHEEGGPLRVLKAGTLWLLAQDVPASAFTETALAERLNRPEELERCARAHHRGVEAAARQGPVVPLPMATLYRGDANAVDAVTAHAPALAVLLDRLRDRTEWAVKVHAAAAAAPDAPPPADENGPVGGRAYLSRASARRRNQRATHEQALAEAREVDRRLRRYAVATTRHRPQGERLSGRRTPQLLNAAYLVNDVEQEDFARVLADAAGGDRHPHVDITASGPWVPYSFARPDQDWTDLARKVGT